MSGATRSPEMVALVRAALGAAYTVGTMAETDDLMRPKGKAAAERSYRTEAALLAAIAKLEAARDEATRRLAVVEEAVRAVLATFDAEIARARKLDRASITFMGREAVDITARLRAAMENPK